MWNYENYLKNQLITLQEDLGLEVGIEVCEEQMFMKIKEYFPNTIYCVLKYLSTTIQFGAVVRPIQIMIMSEANQLNNAKILFDSLANNYNWVTVIEGSTYVKQQYSSPVVLSNFNDVSYTFRSILYISTTLIEMNDVVDIQGGFNIGFVDENGNEQLVEGLQPISQQFQYVAGADTQPVGNFRISETIKSVSTFSLTLIVAPTNNAFLQQCLKISKGTVSGNTKFNIAFTIGGVPFDYDMVLTTFNHNSAINEIPGISIGLMR